ncbi:hypothetical protein BHF69_05350 [Anaerostipes sp. 992a]|nr:hypothetical protein BHF69_05350 [Anaerostipes sp. 992a]
MSKVMKYELKYLGEEDFYEMQKMLWSLQEDTREILNKTIQIFFHWDYTNKESLETTGKALNLVEETGYKDISGYVYDKLKSRYPDMSRGNLSATIRAASKKYRSSKVDILKGTMSIPSYKKDQPIILRPDGIRLHEREMIYTVELSLFSGDFKKKKAWKSNVLFQIKACDKAQKAIMQRLLSREYKLGESKLVYKKKKWFIYITYSFKKTDAKLDKNKILGVDLGVTYAIYACSIGEYGSFSIKGEEALEYAKRLEARTISKQKQARYCGEGRIGHGIKTRLSTVYSTRNKLANHRDTLNHRYSKAVVDYAVKNRYGTIQMENLSCIKKNTGFPKRLQHWTYYDLQSKIEYKAAEQGIQVIKINPKFTSLRCSQCGCIHKDNRKTQESFQCVECGYKDNADHNAALNISIPQIDLIIKEEMTSAKEK